METNAEPQLVIRTSEPLNAETPLALLAEALTPAGSFYVRSHLPAQEIDAGRWRLAVDGEVESPFSLSLAELKKLPEVTWRVTLECAGNGRAFMAPRAKGTPWQYGAVSTADFTGAALAAVLERARLKPGVVEVLAEGADRGEMAPGRDGPYQRSLPVADAMSPGALLAWAMNGEPLAHEHGFPLRLVVPGWYGMAAVKWITRLTALDRPFEGYYQKEQYIYRGVAHVPEGAPLAEMQVRALIARPPEGAVLPSATTEIAGTAWSGAAEVRRVDISVDGGQSWGEAELGPSSPGVAAAWRFAWTPGGGGEYTLVAWAHDGAGNSQPLEPRWNELGYGNNAVQRVRVIVQ